MSATRSGANRRFEENPALGMRAGLDRSGERQSLCRSIGVSKINVDYLPASNGSTQLSRYSNITSESACETDGNHRSTMERDQEI